MDAVELLQPHIKVEELLTHYDFSRMRPEGMMIRSCCKLHGGDNPTSFVINSETGLWYCHTGECGGGDAFTLVQKMEEISFVESVKWIAEFFGVDIQNLQITERKEAYVTEMKAWIKAMKSRKKKELKEYDIPEQIKEVTKFRSFDEKTLRHFGLGWVESVKLEKRELDENGNKQFYELRNRLAFPIWQNGVRVGISFRRVAPNDVPKWSHQPLSIETKNILYNYDSVIGCPEVVVVEGLPDVWAYHELGIPCVATFGAHLTDEQYKLLMRLGADITLSYDGDESGFIATNKAKELFKNKAIIRKVEFQVGEDPENIPREELAKRYEGRIRI